MCENKGEKHIAFLLGAGFSVPAGLPTANVLNSFIISEIYNRIRNSFKEGVAESNYMLQSYILEKVLIDSDGCGDFNYEQYYDFLKLEKKRILDADKLLSFIERGMYGYFWKCSNGNDTENEKRRIKINNMVDTIKGNCNKYSEVVEGVEQWYQYFIARNLTGNTKKGKLEKFNPYYQKFIDTLSVYVNQGYIIDIYTLNHDLFLESLLFFTEFKDKVCNGFGGEINKICGKEYKTFNTKYYDKDIRIYKLHGSIDIHELSDELKNKQYIQILDGYSIENAFLMDEKNFSSILPLFLTGKQKDYEEEPYRSMISEFKSHISDTEKLIVIGYSGNDKGINKILYDNFTNWNDSYVVAPSANEHVFVKDKNAKSINKGVEKLSAKDIN